MTSYLGKHAELYDHFYANKNYFQEAQQIHNWLQKYSSHPVYNLIEIACGTGNHALKLAKYNYEIFATDYSTDMINMAKKKLTPELKNVKFSVQDMRSLPEPNLPFDAAICLFDSIGYAQTNEAIHQVFQGINKSLRRGGLFIFEFWHAAAMIKYHDAVRIKNLKMDNYTIQRISETSIDFATQICTIKYTINEFNRDTKKYSKIEEIQKNRFFLLEEMKLFIDANNFEFIMAFDGYNTKKTIDDTTWHILVVCKKC